MKTYFTSIILALITVLFTSCSYESNDTEKTSTVLALESTIDSFSKNYGYIGDVVVINGKNFSKNLSDVEVFFDNIPAKVKSVSNTKIEIVLPKTKKPISPLQLNIKNRNITNNVNNNYSNSIGIIDDTPNEWHSMNINYPNKENVYVSKSIGKEKFYFSTDDCCGTGIYRTLDGGLTWNIWGRSGFYGDFYVTNNDEGWTQPSFGVNKVPLGGSESINMDVHESTLTNGLYIDDDLKNGFLVHRQKIVYQTTDGKKFTEVYNNNPISKNDPNGLSSAVRFFSPLDKDHFWAAGYTDISNEKFPRLTGTRNFVASLILFLDNGNWKEVSIKNLESSTDIKQIQFINKKVGYINIANSNLKNPYNDPITNKIFKSTDGGNSWSLIYDNKESLITSFSFKDETLGWYSSGNKVYKTLDGGSTWSIDYTHNSDIKKISYDNELVWALSNNKIFKYFLK